MSEPNSLPPVNLQEGHDNYRRRLGLGLSLFGIFFVFYVGTAVLQTPAFKTLASQPCLGMPLGLFLSLAIFPVSWALIIVYFAKSK
jgi:uncharacterized membrane protein (DUF485 family)